MAATLDLGDLRRVTPIDSGVGLGRGKPVDRFTAQSLGRLFGEPFGSSHVEGEAYGSVLASTAFLPGLRADDLRRDELDHRDQRCQSSSPDAQ